MAPARDDRSESLELRVSRLAWRMDALEQDVSAVRADAERLGLVVEGLSLEDRIRVGVTAALERRTGEVASATAEEVARTGGPIILTWPQKIGGAVAAAVLILDAAKGFIS